MTELLERFMNSADDRNLRGDLDGAAWRFVLPREVGTIMWQSGGAAGERDRKAMERHATVLRPTHDPDGDRGRLGSDVELFIGPGASTGGTALLGLDLDEGGPDVGGGRRLALRYEGDELRGVAPADDRPARALLERHVGPDGPVPRSWKRRVRRVQTRTRRTVTGSLRGVRPGPPAWLVAAAADAGIDVAGHSWALWCRGDYGSQKLVMFLMPPGDTEPSAVVKITRDPRFNDRLVNESDMLRAIDRSGQAVAVGAPRLLFDTTAWGSAVSVQSAVTGTDLRRHLRDRPELLGDVTTWMIRMAEESRSPLDSADVRACLGEVLDRYCGAYDVGGGVERFLRRQVEIVSGFGLFAVMQHGDPGPWNALVTPDGEVVFLDWEAGERCGLPLWDLLYFLRSASLVMSMKRPWQSRRSRTRRDLVDGSAFGDLVAEHVHDYVHAVGLDPRAVEPLFHLCWVHRAVKQAARLDPDRRSAGTFHRLVHDGVEGRDRPGLRRITMRAGAHPT